MTVQFNLFAGTVLKLGTKRHHDLLLGPDGRRFATLDRSETLRSLRERGMTPADLRKELGFG